MSHWALLLSGVMLLLAFALYHPAAPGRPPPPRWRRAALPLASSAPVLLLAVAILGDSSRFGSLRIETLGLQIGAQSLESAPFRAGGAASSDDLVGSPLLPASLLQIGADPKAPTEVRPEVRALAASDPAAVVLDGGAPIGALPLPPGAAVCLEQCSAANAEWLTMAANGDRLVTSAARAIALPRLFRREVLGFHLAQKLTGISALGWTGLEGRTDWGPQGRIYPLRDFGCPAASPCVLRSTGRAPRSFLYRRGGADAGHGDLFFMPLDPGAAARDVRGQLIQAPPIAPVTAAAPGKPRRLSLRPVIYADITGKPTAPDGVASQLGVGLTFDAATAGADLLVTPRAAPLLVRPDWLTQDGPENADRQFSLAATNSVGTARNEIPLPRLGGPLGAGVGATIDLGRPGAAESTGTPVGVVADGLTTPPRFGDIFQLGTAAKGLGDHNTDPARRIVTMRLDWLGQPTLLLAISAIWAGLLYVAQRRVWITQPAIWIIASLLQFLLALRVVVAIDGSYLDPTIEHQEVIGLAILAAVVGPYTLAQLGSRVTLAETLAMTIFSAAAVTAIAIAFHVLHIPRPGDPSDKVYGLALVSIALAALVASQGAAALARHRATRDSAVPPEPLPIAAAAAPKPPRLSGLVLGVCLALGLVLIRLAFWAFGVKERLGVSLSVFYTPLSLLSCALILAHAHRQHREGRSALGAGYAFAAVALFLYAVTPALLSDSGYFIYGLPVIGVAAATAPWKAPSRPLISAWSALAWIGPAAAVAVLGLYLLLGPAQNGGLSPAAIRAAGAADDDGKSAVALVDRLRKNDSNALRVDAIRNPDLLFASGAVHANELRTVLASLKAYTNSATGRGLLAPSRLNLLPKVHMTDNVSAVHIMSVFGRLGAAAFLAVLGLGAALAAAAQSSRQGSGAIWARLAVWTIFAVAAYLVLANLVLLPFVGKNVYLLAATSFSDLIEGTTLLIGAALLLGRNRA